MPADAQTFAGTEYRAAQGYRAHVDTPGLFVGVDQPFAAFGVRFDPHADFIGHAPTGTEQTVATLVAAVVEALPADGQDTGQDKVQLVLAAEYLGAGSGVHRIGRPDDGIGQRADGLAGDEGVDPGQQHARQVAEKFSLAALEHHQRGDCQADARSLAAADFTHHHRAAADGDVG